MSETQILTLSSQTAVPHLAPLPVPVVEHLAAFQMKSVRPHVALTLDDELERATRNFHATWSELERTVREKRARAYDLLSEVAQGELSTSKLQEVLRSFNYPVTKSALSRWRDSGLLRYDERNMPNADSVAAIIIARMIDTRDKVWRPPEMSDAEPYWYCWRQDTPNSPAVPCPIPLPQDLPRAAFLWTPWEGAAWSEGWINKRGMGAVRWSSTQVLRGKLLWNISQEELRRWDPGVFTLTGEVEETAPEVLHTLANLALLRLAQAKLSPLASGALST